MPCLHIVPRESAAFDCRLTFCNGAVIVTIGQLAVVTEEINNIEAKGAVKVGGIVWSARSETDETIETGKTVTVTKIDGVKLIVR